MSEFDISRYKQYVLFKGLRTTTYSNVVTFEVRPGALVEVVRGLYQSKKLSLKFIDVTDERAASGCFKIWYVFGVPGFDNYVVPYICLSDTDEFPSVSSVTYAASAYERKIKSFFGLTAVGNPDQRPLVLHENWPPKSFPLRKDFAFGHRPKTAYSSPYQFDRVEGEGVYEIPVGPIHAGIIEPGHFRFSVAGESILLLEARLGYVHKGSEKLFERLSLADQVRLSEKISGDSSFSHSLAFCQAIEHLSGLNVPLRGLMLRTLYGELERIANHIGDLGFIMLDTGYNFGGANGARLREMVMRLNQRLSGHRFLRGVNLPGGVARDIAEEKAHEFGQELSAILADFEEVIHITESSDTLLDRVKGTGVLSHSLATEFGVVGVAARAVGIKRDARTEHPYAAYRRAELKPSIAVEQFGDVRSRFLVRVHEVKESARIVLRILKSLPNGTIAADHQTIELRPNAVAIGGAEGWRGEIVYGVFTGADGKIERVVVRDPSFINWQVLGSCGQGQIVPDFPLINKSFNLSYSGNDL